MSLDLSERPLPAAGDGAGGAWHVRRFEAGVDDAAWDALVAGAVNGTFVHTRRFLSYHGDRFVDRSLVMEDRDGRMRAVLPAALDRSDPGIVMSHPGLTLAGVVHDGTMRAGDMTSLLRTAGDLYRRDGARFFRYKATPGIFHHSPTAEDIYALFRLGATRHRCDLAATVDLARRLPLGRSRQKPARAARNRGVESRWGWDAGPAYWHLLGQVLSERHGATPVHTLDEISLLARLFPDEVLLVSAWLGEELVAGGVMFCMGPVMHLQYSASSVVGRKVGGTDVVIEAGIQAAAAAGYRYFDFGISTEEAGWVLNAGLHDFKLSFGAGTTVFEHYELAL